MTGLAALTERMVVGQLHGDLPLAILAPVGNFLVFNFAFRNLIDTGAMSYSQYVLPAIVIQVMLLGALTTVDRAALDQQSDFGVRLRTFPIAAGLPLMARMSYCLIRGALSLIAAVSIGYLYGFRISGGFAHTIAFVVLVLGLTLALSLAADALGSRASPDEIGRSVASTQLLLVPQMLLVMLSTGMAPMDSFPDWLQPFVRYQPISQITETLRGFASGQVVISNLAASASWCIGLLVVFGGIALRTQGQTR
jgi:ABC-2 type transport system permease protein